MKNREIELKYITALSFEASSKALKAMLYSPLEIFQGLGTDYVWAVDSDKVDFVRLRDNHAGSGELTIKKKDKDSNFDRMEKNVEVSDVPVTLSILTDLYGEPKFKFTKEISVYCDEDDPDLVLSAYRIVGQPETYIEVESPDTYEVRATRAKVLDVFNRLGSNTYEEPRSLYEIMTQGGLSPAPVDKKVVRLNPKRVRLKARS